MNFVVIFRPADISGWLLRMGFNVWRVKSNDKVASIDQTARNPARKPLTTSLHIQAD